MSSDFASLPTTEYQSHLTSRRKDLVELHAPRYYHHFAAFGALVFQSLPLRITFSLASLHLLVLQATYRDRREVGCGNTPL